MLEVPRAVLPSHVSEELMFAPALVTVSIEDPLELCTPVVLQPWNQPSPQGALVPSSSMAFRNPGLGAGCALNGWHEERSHGQ